MNSIAVIASRVCGRKPWVARILGTDKETYLKREFLVPSIDGDRFVFSLDFGGLYQIHNPTGSRSHVRQFVRAEWEGMKRVTNAEAIMRACEMDKKEEGRHERNKAAKAAAQPG